MTDYEQTEVPLKYNYGRIYVSSAGDMARLLEMSRTTNNALEAELSRAHADIVWQFRDQEQHAHIGPQHRPGRVEWSAAREAVRQRNYFRSLGRPRGPYRR